MTLIAYFLSCTWHYLPYFHDQTPLLLCQVTYSSVPLCTYTTVSYLQLPLPSRSVLGARCRWSRTASLLMLRRNLWEWLDYRRAARWVCVCSAPLLYPSVEDATATKTLSVEGLYTYWMVGCVNSLDLHQSSHTEEPASYPGYTNNWRWPGHGFSYVLCQCIKLTITLLTGNSHSRWWRPCQGVTRAAALSSGCIVCLKSPCTSLERRSSFHAV